MDEGSDGYAAHVRRLDSSQEAIVGDRGRALCVLGAAGTGKTTALVERVASLLEEGVAPETILVLSPSREAATSLRAWLTRRTRAVRSGPWARTPHSFAFDVVRSCRGPQDPPPRLMTGGEQERIIAELLAGHAEDGDGPEWPDPIGAEVRALPKFRSELRDFMDRCTDLGVPLRDLEDSGRPVWTAAANFLREYREVLALRGEALFDAADLLAEASRALRAGNLPAHVRGIRHVLVDDSQEMTEGVLRLLSALVTPQMSVATFGDPDTATNEFRGGVPELASTLCSRLGLEPRVVELGECHRFRGVLASAVQRVEQHIGTALAGGQRAALRVAVDGSGSFVQARVVATPGRNAALLADLLRRRHLLDHVDWSEMAVIVRSSADVEPLVRALDSLGVPLTVSGRPVLAREHPATRVLLLGGAWSTGVLRPGVADLEEILTSYLGGLDRLELRRLRRQLRIEEVDGGGNRLADELLDEALSAPGRLASVDLPAARRAERLVRAVARARRTAQDGGSAEEILWDLWSAAAVGERWRRTALGSGQEAFAAGRDIDAVNALFTSARRFTEQHPRAAAVEFFRDELERSVEDDAIVPQKTTGRVWIGTPQQLIGREYDTVIVSGVLEGTWPDLRRRDTLLRAGELPTLLNSDSVVLDERKAVLDSELRMFARAVSRAKNRVIVTSIDGEDDQPSPFVRLVDPDAPEEAEKTAWHPYTLRGYAGMLRRRLAENAHRGARDHGPGTPSSEAFALAALARANVPGAHPRQWHGLGPRSTEEPIGDAIRRSRAARGDQGGSSTQWRFPLSPSRLAGFEECSLHWFLDAFGANSAGPATSIGTLVHQAFEVADEHTDVDELAAIVDGRWQELVFDAPWESARRRADVQAMLVKIHSYLLKRAEDKAAVVAREVPFRDESLPGVVLIGKIDRVERLPDGSIVVVDLKTGRRKPTKAEALTHAQLAVYQLAVNDGAVAGIPPGAHIDSARLLHVGTDRGDEDVSEQPGATPDVLEETRDRVRQAVVGMAGASFVASLESHCLGDRGSWHVSCRIQVRAAVCE